VVLWLIYTLIDNDKREVKLLVKQRINYLVLRTTISRRNLRIAIIYGRSGVE
jgi:hypothetical protein